MGYFRKLVNIKVLLTFLYLLSAPGLFSDTLKGTVHIVGIVRYGKNEPVFSHFPVLFDQFLGYGQQLDIKGGIYFFRLAINHNSPSNDVWILSKVSFFTSAKASPVKQ